MAEVTVLDRPKKRPYLRMVNRLRITRNGNGKYQVKSPHKPPRILKEFEDEEQAYNWAHRNRRYADKEPPWADYELQFLADNYGRLPAEEIARRLRRTTNALKIISFRKLGINQKSNIYSARATAEVMGLSCAKIVVFFHERGFLEGKRAPLFNGKNQVWFFEEEDILRCLKSYPWLVNRKRMPPGIFRQVVMKEWDRDPWYNKAETAVFLGLSPSRSPAIFSYIKNGWLSPMRRPGAGGKGYWIFRQSDLNRFLADDPRPDHRKEATLTVSLRTRLDAVEKSAWRALAKNHLQQFGHWAGVWQQLNNLGYRQKSPFGQLVDIAKEKLDSNNIL